MLRFVYLSALAALFFAAPFTSLKAQSPEDVLEIGTPPSWVEAVPTPEAPFNLAVDLSVAYEIVARQRFHTRETSAYHYRYRTRVKTPSAVENNAEISFRVDPSYQTLRIHNILVIRGTQRMAHGEARSDFDIYRVEDDRDQLVYNKDVQVSYIIPDLRAGDVIDYSYTISGRNPAIGPNFVQESQLQYDPPVQVLLDRTIVADDLSAILTFKRGAVEPSTNATSLGTEYHWSLQDIPGYVAEDNVPYWAYTYPTAVMRTFKTWADVGTYFAPFYAPPETIPEDLDAEINRIASAYTSEKGRARAALDYVQSNIRYLAINLGAGGYVPRDVATIMARRFGDCKDMTLLLHTMMAKLGIASAPILVDTDYRGEIDRLDPGYGVFNHIVLGVMVEGKPYFLDGTRGQQLGTLDTLAQANYERGLEVSAQSKGLIPMNPQPYPFQRVFTADFTFDPLAPSALFTQELKYFSGHADGIKNWLERDGRAAVAKDFLEFYVDTYPSIEPAGEMAVDIDEDAATLTLTLPYKIANAWEDAGKKDGERFESYPREVYGDFPDFTGGKRTLPLYLNHPVRTKEVQIFRLDPNWEIEPETYVEDHPSYYYSRKSEFKETVLRDEYEYYTKLNYIAPDGFEATMATIKTINDDMGQVLTRYPETDGYALAVTQGVSAKGPVEKYGTLVALIALIGFAIWAKRLSAGIKGGSN